METCILSSIMSLITNRRYFCDICENLSFNLERYQDQLMKDDNIIIGFDFSQKTNYWDSHNKGHITLLLTGKASDTSIFFWNQLSHNGISSILLLTILELKTMESRSIPINIHVSVYRYCLLFILCISFNTYRINMNITLIIILILYNTATILSSSVYPIYTSITSIYAMGSSLN